MAQYLSYVDRGKVYRSLKDTVVFETRKTCRPVIILRIQVLGYLLIGNWVDYRASTLRNALEAARQCHGRMVVLY